MRGIVQRRSTKKLALHVIVVDSYSMMRVLRKNSKCVALYCDAMVSWTKRCVCVALVSSIGLTL